MTPQAFYCKGPNKKNQHLILWRYKLEFHLANRRLSLQFFFNLMALKRRTSCSRGALRAKCVWHVEPIEKVKPLTYTTDDYNKHLCTVLHPELAKYYKNRFSLFSLYNSGVVLDKEGWYSVTPEEIAIQQASRVMESDIVVDLCCGCGGNSIQFAQRALVTFSVDIDATRLCLARYNANIYGVAGKIQFIQSGWLDLIQAGPTRRHWADVVFMSPPWGGISYMEATEFDIHGLFDGITLVSILTSLSQVAPKVIIFLPRNSNRSCVVEAARASGAIDLEIEVNRIGKFEKGITIYLNYAI